MSFFQQFIQIIHIVLQLQIEEIIPVSYQNCDRIWENPPYANFFEIEFDVWLISSTIELSRVQVSDQLCTLLWSYSALFAIAPHPQYITV